MAEEEADEIPVLSLGSISGGGPGSHEWKEALRAVTRRIQVLREGRDSPLHVNVIYFIPGGTVHPDFVGVRTGSYSKARHALIVQVALPDTSSARPQEQIRDLLVAAIAEAEEFARRRRIAENLAQLRAIVDLM